MTEQHTNPDHDYESQRGKDNRRRALWFVQNMPHCKYCLERRTLVAMTGDGWGFIHEHEATCPYNEDNHDAHEVLVEETYDGGVHSTAEAIWSLPRVVPPTGDG